MRILVGFESSGRVREALRALGHDAWSCDLQPADDGSHFHIQGNVFDHLDGGWDAAIFHPTCTYLTSSAEWAFNDPDFDRYPGVGYHQKLKPGTLFGADRRAAREEAVQDVLKLVRCKIPVKVIENPVGHLSARIGKAHQIVQPYQFGDDASKGTCFWFFDADGNPLPHLRLTVHTHMRFPGRWVLYKGKLRERWSNQTDSGQNRLADSDDRWKLRSKTYPGIAVALSKALSIIETPFERFFSHVLKINRLVTNG